jgi:hypothetical protein
MKKKGKRKGKEEDRTNLGIEPTDEYEANMAIIQAASQYTNYPRESPLRSNALHWRKEYFLI